MSTITKKPFDLGELKKQLQKKTKKTKRAIPKRKITYGDSIVAFIDLLGFSEQISKLNKKKSIEMIEKLEWIFENVVNPSAPSQIQVNYFSDCICISENLPSKDSESYLDTVFYFLHSLIIIQGELIFQDILVRGGVSIDRHYASNRIIFSKGLLKSYKIESKKAKNPVIMLDESVYSKIVQFHKKNPGGYLNEKHYYSKVNSLLNLSIEQPNGQHVLNYLSFWAEVDHESYILPYFKKHKDLIEAGAKAYLKDDHILSKYKWMANYHNFYLTKVYELQPEVHKEFLIDTSVIFGEFSLPKV